MKNQRVDLGVALLAVCPLGCFQTPTTTGDGTTGEATGEATGGATGEGTSGSDESRGPTTASSGDPSTTTSATGDTGGSGCGSPDAPDCGAHGTCVDNAGGPSCQCTRGYAGPSCSTCASGFSDTVTPGTCAADCGTCAAHALCDGDLDPPACTCAAGYGTDAAACSWEGGLEDPLFTEMKWTADAATIDPAGFGNGEGSAIFKPTGLCTGGSVSQTVTMPSWDLAEPFVLELEAHRLGGSSGCWAIPYLSVNNHLTPLTLPDGPSGTASLCLGEAAYGGTTTFSFLADLQTGKCFSGGPTCDPVTLRRASIRAAAANECPVPGAVRNGTFDTDATGWDVVASQANGEPTTGEVKGGALVLASTYGCSTAEATQALSFPLPTGLANAALAFSVTGTADKVMDVRLSGRPWASMVGTGAKNDFTLCLPGYAQGTVNDVTFALQTANACLLTDTRSLVLDDVQFVSDPKCTADAYFDGDFEDTAAGAGPWSLTRGDYANNDATAQVFHDPATAHAGNGVLKFVMAGAYGFGEARATTNILVPAASGTMKPALRFWARDLNVGLSNVGVFFGSAYEKLSALSVPKSTAWTEYEVCINVDWAGQVVPLGFEVTTGSGSGTPNTHFVDDVRVVLSSGC